MLPLFTKPSQSQAVLGGIWYDQGMLIGYVWVSTQDQKLAAQHDALKSAGVEKIFAEKISGAKRYEPQFANVQPDPK